MKVNGTETIKRNATIEISASECFKSICRELGVGSILYNNDDTIYRAVKENGKIVKFVEEQDISRHGSPCWEPTGNEVTDPKLIELCEHCKAIKDIIRQRELEAIK